MLGKIPGGGGGGEEQRWFLTVPSCSFAENMESGDSNSSQALTGPRPPRAILTDVTLPQSAK